MRDDQKTKLARRLRRDANAPERAAWAALRMLRERGFAVRRQHPVGPYVVDFAIVARKLVIEIDGGVHRLKAADDALRQSHLEGLGWRVVRVKPEVALSRDHLLDLIERVLGN